MTTWSHEIKDLEKLYDHFKNQYPGITKELEKLIKADDENMVLVYSRRCLEVIIADLSEQELKRPRGTEPLKGIKDKLNREEKVPHNIIISMQNLNSLSSLGAHPRDFDPRQVKPVLLDLTTILEWYLKYMDNKIGIKGKEEETKAFDKSARQIRKPKKRLIFMLSGALLVAAIVVVILFLFNIISGGKQAKAIEKSIAVLPFKSLSNDPEKQYLADGMMDAILLHLSKIEDLRVLSRTSVEQYRNTDKTSGAIG